MNSNVRRIVDDPRGITAASKDPSYQIGYLAARLNAANLARIRTCRLQQSELRKAVALGHSTLNIAWQFGIAESQVMPLIRELNII